MKTELTMEESLRREKGMIFPQDFSERTLLAVAHSRNCITALEKQLEKQPKNIEKITFDGSIRGNFKNGECPCCRAYVDTDDDPNVCGECGQRLGW